MADANAALMEAEGETTAVAHRAPATNTQIAALPQSSGAMFAILERIMTDTNLPIERINQAFDFYQRMDQAQAKKAFTEAKAAFKANAPTIIKDMKNKQYDSSYSSIGNVVGATNEALSKHGLDASWEFDQGEKSIKVTCVLTHARGHSERVSLSGPPDVSGSKNPIQQIKSTTTYLKLATYEAVTGIASEEGNANDDGNGAGASAAISEEQLSKLQLAIVDTNVDLVKFNKYFKIAKVDDLPATRFDEAMTRLDQRREKSQ
jgi:hypothetical protein